MLDPHIFPDPPIGQDPDPTIEQKTGSARLEGRLPALGWSFTFRMSVSEARKLFN